MPSSSCTSISYICSRISELKPKTVLDIGVGFGKYGFLAREYAGGFSLPTEEKELLVVDGIEIYEPYIQPIHKLIYNKIYMGSAVKLLESMGIYDLILCVDMLEHMWKGTGLIFLRSVAQHSKAALIALPINPSRQWTVFGNKYERHVSVWNTAELAQFGQVITLKNEVFVLEMK